jgi:hypothetical protein
MIAKVQQAFERAGGRLADGGELADFSFMDSLVQRHALQLLTRDAGPVRSLHLYIFIIEVAATDSRKDLVLHLMQCTSIQATIPVAVNSMLLHHEADKEHLQQSGCQSTDFSNAFRVS